MDQTPIETNEAKNDETHQTTPTQTNNWESVTPPTIEEILKPVREMAYKVFRRQEQGLEAVDYVVNPLISIMQSRSFSYDLLIRTLGHYLAMHLPPSWLEGMCRFMLDQIELLVRNFLNFKHYFACYFLPDEKRARIFVFQSALHRRYPLLISEGCASLSRSPVFYGTKQSSLFRGSARIAWELLQNAGSFKIIPSSQKESSDHPFPTLTMDLDTLEQEIERDQAKGKLPCVIVASHIDDLERIRGICDRHGLWLHVEGDSSSLLLAAASSLPKATRALMACADSISCQPFRWFQCAGWDAQSGYFLFDDDPEDISGCSSTLTFIKNDSRDTPPPTFSSSDTEFVQIFPLWHLLATRSVREIKAKVDHSLALCAFMKSQLNEHKNAFATAIGPGPSVPHVLLFQIVPQGVYLNAFRLDTNTFQELLIQRCVREIAALQMGWKVYQEQTCFRFEPLTISASELIKQEHITHFVQKIVININVLKKCLEYRRLLQELLNECEDLQWIEPAHVTSFVGLGAFRFLPLFFRNDINSESVYLLNKALAEELSNKKSIYKFAVDIDHLPCITVNPDEEIFEENCVKNIVNEISKSTQIMPYPEEVMEEMAETVKMGIQIAEKEVQDEASLDYHPDQIVRKIPVVGSIYNWILPSNDQQGKNLGKTFSILSRKLITRKDKPLSNNLDSENSLEENSIDMI